MNESYSLKDAIKIRCAMEEYQDTKYMNILRQLNEQTNVVLTDDLGTEFVQNCGRDLAGEIVRNCFDTANYNITVDQLATRILKFSYEEDYDPLAKNGGWGDITKTVYNYNEHNSAELDAITKTMEKASTQLFEIDRDKDKLDRNGKKAYRESQKDENGDLFDELTGVKAEKKTVWRNGKPYEKPDVEADHIQARKSAKYNARYITDAGAEELRVFWNSPDNMQMMHKSANASKSDIRVCKVDGKVKYVNARNKEYDASTDITDRATPEQLADAVCAQWEYINEKRKGGNQDKIKKLKEKGYLDENGKVPKSVRKELVRNIKHSQNVESTIILKNTDYKQVGSDALDYTKASIGKIIAGQVIYYAAPPIVYEVKTIILKKDITIENALEKLTDAMKRVTDYVVSKLKDIFVNIAFNSLKKFVKSFMDILINMVKATVKKLLKMAKNLVLSTVDAVRIIANPNSSRAEKADSVVNLYAVTITSCVIEILFELGGDALKIPEPFDDIIFGPLQILTTVICTNFTMLILKKADLFGVRQGFKMSKIRELFADARDETIRMYEVSTNVAYAEIDEIIENARKESLAIYNRLEEYDMKTYSARDDLEIINQMFNMNIDFESDWLKFIGVQR